MYNVEAYEPIVCYSLDWYSYVVLPQPKKRESAMTIAEAAALVLELARENILHERYCDTDLLRERARQIEACNIIEDWLRLWG